MLNRIATSEKLNTLVDAWNDAPGIVRTQVGRLVDPLIDLLIAMNAELGNMAGVNHGKD